MNGTVTIDLNDYHRLIKFEEAFVHKKYVVLSNEFACIMSTKELNIKAITRISDLKERMGDTYLLEERVVKMEKATLFQRIFKKW